MATHILFESASGFALFERVSGDEIAQNVAAIQDKIAEFDRFGTVVKLKSFAPFESAEVALSSINCISEGVLPETLTSFLQLNLPKAKEGKKSKISVGVLEPKLGSAIQEGLGIPCQTSDVIGETIRGIRLHFHKFVQGLESGDLEAAQRGLAHSYSRSKVKFNVNRIDNMIIQVIAILDQLDKDINTFAMRVREWYSWHFPELVKLVNDNFVYCNLVKLIGNKSSLTGDDSEEKVKAIEELTMDEAQARSIVEAAKISMGSDLSEVDMVNIERFADKVINSTKLRKKLHSYLVSRMHNVAPNVAAIIGEQVGARLISHAGSLVNLAKYPASTVQILGAEKALFRALKTKSNTPKYGLLFHSSFIGKANAKDKGRISRFLANKVSIAARLDSFSDHPTRVYGEMLKAQVEERLQFFETGAAPRKNADVMHEAYVKALSESKSFDEDGDANIADASEKKSSKKAKKRSRDEDDEEQEEAQDAGKKKKAEEPSKKSKKKSKEDKVAVEAAAEAADEEEGEKKKKKKSKDKDEKKKKDKSK